MNKNNITTIALLFTIIFGSKTIKAQEIVSLIEAIKEIEKDNITFNYDVKSLQGIKVLIKPKDVSVKDYLDAIAKQNRLDVIYIESNRIVIRPKDLLVLRFLDDKNQAITNLFLQETNNNQQWITNQYGEIELKPIKDSLELMTNHPNFKDSVLVLEPNTPNRLHRITLKRKILGLGELVLKPNFTLGIYRTLSGNNIIKPKKVNQLAGLTNHDIVQSIQNSPEVSSINESGSYLSVKGGNQDENAFYWNNIPIYQNSHLFGTISAFNDNLIDEVLVYDNATPTYYGNATNGTIAINSYQEVPKNNQVGVSLNMLSADFYTQAKVNSKLGLSFSARRSFTDFWESPTYKEYRRKTFQNTIITQQVNNSNFVREDEFYFQDAELHLNYEINPKHKINLNGLYIYNSLIYNEQNTITNVLNQSQFNQRSYLFGLNWQSEWSKKLGTQTSVYFSDYIIDAKNSSTLFGLSNIQSNHLKTWGARWQASYSVSNELKLQAGAELQSTQINDIVNNNLPSVFIDSEKDILTYSANAEFDYQIKQSFLIGAGARLVKYNNLPDFYFEPRTFLRYQINDRISLLARAEQKTQNLSQRLDLQNDFLQIENRRWYYAGRDGQQVLQGIKFDFGVSFSYNQLQINTNVFANDVNGISTRSQGFLNQNQFPLTFGSYKAKGLNTQINYKNNWFNSWVSYTLSENKYNFSELEPSEFFNNKDVSHNITIGANAKYKQFTISASTQIFTGKPYTEVNPDQPITAGNINYLSPNQARLPDYLRIDTSLAYKTQLFNHIKTNIVLSVINLTNNNNELDRFYRLDRVNPNLLDTVTLNGFKLTPNLSIELEF